MNRRNGENEAYLVAVDNGDTGETGQRACPASRQAQTYRVNLSDIFAGSYCAWARARYLRGTVEERVCGRGRLERGSVGGPASS